MTEDLGFIDPTAGGSRTAIALAPRPMDLTGKVVGLLDNTKEQADVILETVAEILRSRYGVADVIIRRKEAFSRPATAALLDEMAKKVQVAATALGG
jgi:urease gamma subunit